MDFYRRMGKELRSLFADLFRPEKRAVIESKMDDILKTATLIGGSIAGEAKDLHVAILHYLKHPKDPKILALLKEHAMRLEQETREI